MGRRLLATFAVLFAALATAGSAAAADALTRALSAGELTKAEYTLERAESLFRLRYVRARYGDVARPDPREATLVLRDLAAQLSELPADRRARAAELLSRPAADARACGEALCVHWAESSPNAPPGADGDPATVPPWVTTTMTVFENVWAQEIGRLGYRPPLSDVTSPVNGGDARLDVYLADVGADGLYGYCASDDPGASAVGAAQKREVSAYCVVDDDFDPGQYPAATGEQALAVTAAHEFFHAVQFSYDWREDLWFMEGTASWVEDEVYDHVNENLGYLWKASVLRHPAVPVDYAGNGFQYGSWIFWRYLSERLGTGIVRDTWERVGGRDAYSLRAASPALAAKGLTFGSVFADFAAANRIPSRRYQEGGAYPTAPAAETKTLSRGRPTTGWRYTSIRHLSSLYYSVRPGRTVSRRATLRVALDGPAR
ncbi:MAG TPA: MXAN_6640 family putative metalloprotease, partial [Gaiellaceae bacterium]|nr:MXAN_6640 family putative metalloprotease [Gaiellaceae bacterium]